MLEQNPLPLDRFLHFLFFFFFFALFSFGDSKKSKMYGCVTCVYMWLRNAISGLGTERAGFAVSGRSMVRDSRINEVGSWVTNRITTEEKIGSCRLRNACRLRKKEDKKTEARTARPTPMGT